MKTIDRAVSAKTSTLLDEREKPLAPNVLDRNQGVGEQIRLSQARGCCASHLTPCFSRRPGRR